MVAETAKNMSEVLSDESGRLDKRVLKNTDLRQWVWKSNQKCRKMGLYTRRDRIEAGICMLSVLLSVAISLTRGMDGMVKATIYMMAAGFLIGFDPLNALGLYLATVTRYLILMSDIMVIVALWLDNDEYRMLTVVVCGITILYMIFLNRKVMRSENWTYSEAIQHALVADPENQSGEAWSRWGKVQCRSLFGQLGYPIDDEIIDGYAKPIFYLTFLKTKGNVWRLEQTIAQNRQDMENLKSQYAEAKATIEHLSEVVDELKRKEDMLKFYEDSYKKMNKLAKENELLRAVNEELLGEMDEPGEVIEVVQSPDDRYLFMTEQERVFELFKRGYKNVDITKLTGVKRSTVSDWRKKFEEKMENE